MNCNDCLSIIEDYVEDSPDRQTFAQAARHIAACEECRTIYEELKNEREIYSRYLLKIKEQPESWDAVRAEIRKETGNAEAATAFGWFYEKFSAMFLRQPLYGAMALLILIIGIGFGLRYRADVPKTLPADSASSSSETKGGELVSNEKRDDNPSAENPVREDVKDMPDGKESRILKDKKSLAAKSKLIYPVRFDDKKKRGKPITINTENRAEVKPTLLDFSEAAFNRHIEKCEMVLRSFRNSIAEKDESGVDISFEKRMAKELLSNSVKFRREAQSQGNLPVEQLLLGLEVILDDITKLPEKATLTDANLIKGRIQESGIIAKLQIQSSLALASN